MNRCFKITGYILAGLVLFSFSLFAEESNSELVQEVESMKQKIKMLEASIEKKEAGLKASSMDADTQRDGLLSIISIGGLIEVEAGYESMDFSDPGEADSDSSDIALATVELGIDADINEYVSGHILLLWEEDDTEPVDIDEGFISVNGGDELPFYLDAGKMYVPFGSFESHFISDPITLEIGETRESAIRAGYANDMFDVSFSVFNGDIDEVNDDDEVKTFVGSAVFTLPEDAVPDLGLSAGISYISNIADSDGLTGEVVEGAVSDTVSGLGLFASLSYMDKFFIEAEYLGATERFSPGELSFDNGLSYKPRAYNLEVAWAFNDKWEAGVKYEGGNDLGDFLPEKQYGCVLNYGLFENTSLGIEYLHGEFENEDEIDLITAQFAIEF
ncbi:MAG: LbtU family siderophore porin [Deltaproteobacteria bacterium]|nr:LbtU family siderophore porin [Deltaproteobacteria bacterium]